MRIFKTKDITYSIKDMDMKEGIVQLYASSFDNKDDDGDVIQRGAYAKTINENGVNGKNRIKHLYQHDVKNIIGRPIKMYEDEKGLFVESYVSEKQNGDYRKMYEEGLITEHSVGFMTIDEEKMEDHNLIKEIKLMEYSAVTFGANANTPVVAVKNLTQKLDSITNMFRNGTLTDEGFNLLAIMYEQVKAEIMKSLKAQEEPTEPVTQKKQEPIDLIQMYNKI